MDAQPHSQGTGRPRLLIAYDGSDPARAAVRAAGALFPQSPAVIAHAYDPPAPPERAYLAGAIPNEALRDSFAELEREALDDARATVEDGRALAADAGLAAEPAAVPASRGVWPQLLDAAREHGAEVIVCGTRGRGAVGRALLGSVSSSLLHQGDLPLLIVPSGEHELSGPVVFGYDGSDGSRDALSGLARLLPGRRVSLVHAWAWAGTDSWIGSAALTGPVDQARDVVEFLRSSAEQRAREVADEGRRIAEEHGLTAEPETVETIDGIWRSIASAARERDAAMIAIGSRGRGGIASSLLGSVSTALAHNAERPTLVVRPSG